VTFGSILFLALGLAMDATAAAAVRGFVAREVRARDALLVAFFFGGFQAAMPLLGWALGARLGAWVGAFSAWIAFFVLAGLGAKMLHEARGGASELPSAVDAFRARVLLPLAVATSLDALAVGVTLPLVHAPFALSLATIGLVTAVLSFAAVWLGRRFGERLGRRLDAAGGLVLIALGAKILLEHLLFENGSP
jgi:putative Mn2+ efflux pump MntP